MLPNPVGGHGRNHLTRKDRIVLCRATQFGLGALAPCPMKSATFPGRPGRCHRPELVGLLAMPDRPALLGDRLCGWWWCFAPPHPLELADKPTLGPEPGDGLTHEAVSRLIWKHRILSPALENTPSLVPRTITCMATFALFRRRTRRYRPEIEQNANLGSRYQISLRDLRGWHILTVACRSCRHKAHLRLWQPTDWRSPDEFLVDVE